MLNLEDIKFDCSLYNGYKPCPYGNACAGCVYYDPLPGTPGLAASALPRVVHPVLSLDSPPTPVRILIIKIGAMGDVLRTTTLLPTLERMYPESVITWITDPSACPLLSANPYIDELLPFTDDNCNFLISRSFDLLMNYEKEPAPLALAGQISANTRIGFCPTPSGLPTIFNKESGYGLLLGKRGESNSQTF